MFRKRNWLAAMLVGLLAMATIVGPAAAAFDWGQTGRVGPHSISDSEDESSVRCSYRTVSEQDHPDGWYRWQGKLDRIDVRPPEIWSVRGTQRVAWRFLVQRAKEPNSTFSDVWSTTYRSAIQTGTATQVEAASFTPMHIGIDVPPGTLESGHSYRIMVKLFWYRQDGSVQGTAKYLLSYYELFFKEHVQATTPPWCDGRTSYWLPD